MDSNNKSIIVKRNRNRISRISYLKREAIQLSKAAKEFADQNHLNNTGICGGEKIIKKPKCYNCKHASSGFKSGGITHHQCNHPKHNEGFKSGELSPWDTLQKFNNTCITHEF